MAEKPTAAFVLSLIGGIFVLLVGIAFAVLGSILGSMVGGIGGPAGATDIIVWYGVIGFVNGLLMIDWGPPANLLEAASTDGRHGPADDASVDASTLSAFEVRQRTTERQNALRPFPIPVTTAPRGARSIF